MRRRNKAQEAPPIGQHAFCYAVSWEELKDADSARKTLNLLLQMEPGLEKYRIEVPAFQGGRTWDITAMQLALEHRRAKAADLRFAENVVPE